jgi:hypothetical protein
LTNFEARDHAAPLRVQSGSLLRAWGGPRPVKKSEDFQKYICIYFEHAERVLGCLILAENPNFLEFTQGEQERMESGQVN